jgi:hypothetical protein
LPLTELTLLTKAYGASQLKQIDRLLKANLEGLDAKTELSIVDKWVRVQLSGEDEAVATSYIRKEIGLCPESMDNVKRFAILKGYIVNTGKSPYRLHVEVGVFQPETLYASVPLSHLQAVLVDGRKVALKKIAELFGFCDTLPLNFQVTVVDKAEKHMEAELATSQLQKFESWRDSLLDRLIVLGVPVQEIEKKLSVTGLDRDLVNIEPLGIFEHALTCKLGTDAAGLVSQVGRSFRDAKFVVFNPRKIREILAL